MNSRTITNSPADGGNFSQQALFDGRAWETGDAIRRRLLIIQPSGISGLWYVHRIEADVGDVVSTIEPETETQVRLRILREGFPNSAEWRALSVAELAEYGL